MPDSSAAGSQAGAEAAGNKECAVGLVAEATEHVCHFFVWELAPAGVPGENSLERCPDCLPQSEGFDVGPAEQPGAVFCRGSKTECGPTI